MAGSVRELSGYAPADFLADPALFFDIVHPQDRRNFFVLLEGERDRVRIRWIRPQGDSVWVEASAAPVRWEGRLVAIEGRVSETAPPPGRCANYRPVCLRLLQAADEAPAPAPARSAEPAGEPAGD